jgi:hypothetical protein
MRIMRNVVSVFSTIHIWKKEPSLAGVKAIAGAIRDAIHSDHQPLLDPGYRCGDWRVDSMRFLRDPDGETSHGIVTVESVVEVPL